MPRLLVELVEDGRRRLLGAGVPADEARLDSELLARHVLGWDRARFIAYRRAPVAESTVRQFEALLARRAAREPLAHLVGVREFWGRPFLVSRHVLVPRPETERIVELVLGAPRDPARPLRVLDVGTGSGCLAVTIAAEVPTAMVVATDVSQRALDVAHENARRFEVADRVRFVRSSLLDGLTGPFDVIVANPPYVPTGDRPSLAPEVREYEPSLALFAGPDGLDLIRPLVRQAADRLAPDGLLLVEIGAGQDAAVQTFARDIGRFGEIAFERDLQGIPRTLVARLA